jgi:YggT family protein
MDIVVRCVYSGITLYMLAILVVWLSAWIGVETEYGRGHALQKMTDPLLRAVRGAIPNTGPFDLSPFIALMGLWIIRILLVRILFGLATGS